MGVDFSKLKKHEKYQENFGSKINEYNTADRVMQRANNIMNNTQNSSTVSNVNQRMNAGLYTVEKVGSGMLSGATGLLQARNTELAKNLKEGKENSKQIKNEKNPLVKALKKTSDTGSITNLINPMNQSINSIIKNAKENAEILKDQNKNPLQKGIGVVTNTVSNAINMVSPVRQILNPLEQAIGKVLPENASDKVLEVNNKISEPSQKLNEKLAKEGQLQNKAVQFIGDAGQAVGNMVPSILGTAVTKNPTIGLATMAQSAKGQSTQEALNRGADLKEAIKIGDTKGLIEVGTEMLTGGVNIFGKGALDDIIEKGIDKKVKNEVLNYITKRGLDLPEEVAEEVISDVLGTAIDKGTVDPNASYSLSDFKDTAITTMLSTIAINALTGGYGKNSFNQNKTEVQENNPENIIDNSNLNPETKEQLKKLAQKNNWQPEALRNMLEQGGNLNNEQNQGTTIENNEVLQTNQRVTQTQNKMAQNENIEQIGDVPQKYNKIQEQNEKIEKKKAEINRSIDNIEKILQYGNLDLSQMDRYQRKLDQYQIDLMELDEQHKSLANNQEMGYNNIESEVGINGETQNDGERSNGEIWSRNVEESSETNREYTWEEYNKWEQSIKPISTERFTEGERQSIKNAKSEYNKDIRLYDENDNDNTYSGGASRNIPGQINISRQQAEYFGLDYMINHENVESDFMHNDVANDILDPVIDSILEDEKFKNQIVEFWKDQKGNLPKDELIAKDILCDRFAERKSQKATKYQNVLSETTRNTIDMALDNYYKQVYGKELQDFDYNTENPNTGSFSMQEKQIDKYNRYKANIVKNNSKAVNNLISYKNETIESIQNSIAEKENLLNSKKNKDTKVANNIKMQIERLKARKSEIENIYNEKIDKFNSKINKEKLEIETQKQMRKDAREILSLEIKPLLEGSENWKDKSKGIWYNRETAQRNIYDIVKDKEHAELINKVIFNPVQEHQANATRDINNLFTKINDLNLDKKKQYTYIENENREHIILPQKNATTYKVDEATLAQLYLEKKITEEDLKNYKVDIDKIKNTASTFKEILDSLYDQMNETVLKYGYSPIGKIENYFPHFTENKPDKLIGKIASLFGIDTTNQELPTEIAGRTEDFKPGKTWNSNILQRKSNKTDYDALKVMEKYITGAEDIIHTTEDIQRLRQFQRELRYRYSEKGIQERIDEIENNNELMPFEQEEAIESILSNKSNQLHQLGHFVTWLDDYTNILANKKNSGDREFEKNFNRNMYTTMSSIESRIAANTIGGNLSVSLTNFAPLAQAFGTTKTSNLVTGMLETLKNDLMGFVGQKNTSFVDNSDFLTNRFGTDEISQKKISDKISSVASIPMDAIDSFTAESIVRAKYRENLQNGMNEEEALKSADKYAKNLMADRSKGALPVLFNNKNPISKLVTMFQVEPNNLLSNYFKDMPRDAKSKKQLTWSATKLMVGSYAFNTLAMAIRGGNEVLPDPIRMVTYMAKWLFSDDDDEKEQVQNDMIEAIVGATPFVSNVAGLFGMEEVGRIPISSAMPNIASTSDLWDKDVSDEYKKEMLIKEISKPLLYLGLPVGGAQLNKTIQGIATMIVGGSYKTNKEGEKQLQFPVKQNVSNALKATIFGKYSLPEADKYIDSGFKSLNAEATKLYDESGIDYNTLNDYINYSNNATVKDDKGYSQYKDKDGNVYWFDKEEQTLYNSDYEKTTINKDRLEKSKKTELLVDYVNNLKISDEQKMALYKYNIISSTINENGTSAQTSMEYMLKNGMSKKEFMDTYTKAIKNDISYPDIEEYDKIYNADLTVDKYLNYKTEVKKQTELKRIEENKEDAQLNATEKMKILQNSNYSSKDRDAFYNNYIKNKENKEYDELKEYYANNSLLGSKNYKAYDIINQYIDYKIKADDKLKELRANGTKKENEGLTDKEKVQLLVDSKYTNPQTEAMYVNVLASDKNKTIYENLKKIQGGNAINSYTQYLLSDTSADKEDNGLKSGKSVTNSKASKTASVIQGLRLNSLAKTYLYATNNTVTTKTGSNYYYKLKSYVDKLSQKEQKEILSTISSAKETTNGGYYWK